MIEESILISIRKAIGIDEDYMGFDTELIIAINSALFSLSQLGVGLDSGYSISGEEETWSDFFGELTNFEAVKSYILLKTRVEFDPPGTSFLLASSDNMIKEYEWRLSAQAELGETL